MPFPVTQITDKKGLFVFNGRNCGKAPQTNRSEDCHDDDLPD